MTGWSSNVSTTASTAARGADPRRTTTATLRCTGVVSSRVTTAWLAVCDGRAVRRVRNVVTMSDDHLIHYSGRAPFSPGIADRAEGSWVFTEDGRELLDFTSGQMLSLIHI